MNEILASDLLAIYSGLDDKERRKLENATILVTGCGGFIGFDLMHFLVHYREKLGIKKIIGLDRFDLNGPSWIKDMEGRPGVEIYKFNVVSNPLDKLPHLKQVTHVMHLASIASPIYYRKHPIETVDANVWALRRLLDFYQNQALDSFVYFSTSEIYGQPNEGNIPTPESFPGLVASLGPRACYDESKRFGETLCFLYHQEKQMPLRIIRPFNNYGPGMNLKDRRITADISRAVLFNEDMVLFSDGSPTRTYCYISDAIIGYLKGMLHDAFDVFNIGADYPEISVETLAHYYRNWGLNNRGYQGNIRKDLSEDPEYLTHNPMRRCPDLSKAKNVLGYSPKIDLEKGIDLHMRFLFEEEAWA